LGVLGEGFFYPMVACFVSFICSTLPKKEGKKRGSGSSTTTTTAAATVAAAAAGMYVVFAKKVVAAHAHAGGCSVPFPLIARRRGVRVARWLEVGQRVSGTVGHVIFACQLTD